MNDLNQLLEVFSRTGIEVSQPSDAERMFLNSPASPTGRQIIVRASNSMASVFFFDLDGKYQGNGILQGKYDRSFLAHPGDVSEQRNRHEYSLLKSKYDQLKVDGHGESDEAWIIQRNAEDIWYRMFDATKSTLTPFHLEGC